MILNCAKQNGNHATALSSTLTFAYRLNLSQCLKPFQRPTLTLLKDWKKFQFECTARDFNPDSFKGFAVTTPVV